ncbi:MAG: NUDIX domain-containing protein, partial [Bacteroidota bacterium]
MKRVRAAAKALIIQDSQILLLKCQRDGQIYYNLPGGGQEHGERIDEALVRECWEEAGAEVRVKQLVFVRDYISKNHGASDPTIHQLELFFTCELIRPKHPTGGSEPDDDQIGVEWVSLDRLNEIALYPQELLKHLPLKSDVAYNIYWGDVL